MLQENLRRKRPLGGLSDGWYIRKDFLNSRGENHEDLNWKEAAENSRHLKYTEFIHTYILSLSSLSQLLLLNYALLHDYVVSYYYYNIIIFVTMTTTFTLGKRKKS